MEQRTIYAYGYTVTGNDEVISEIENIIPDKKYHINWYNFNDGDFYWSDNGDRYIVSVDHNARTVILKENGCVISMRNDKITINRNGKVITGIHDHHIYDLFYRGVNIGYFAEYYLEKAVKSIEETGFFDGKNYDFRIKNIDESGNEELIMKEIKDCIKKYNHKR